MRVRALAAAGCVATVLLLPVTGAASSAPAVRAQADAASARNEYIALLVALAEQALAEPRLAAPMPCLAHWVAGADNVVLAVSAPGAAAGLARGDTLLRIEARDLTGFRDAVWDAVMRALPPGLTSFALRVRQRGQHVVLTMPCEAGRAADLHAAERAMWTAITRREWTGCVERGRDMLRAFGSSISPPLMMMTRCAAASGRPDAALVHALGTALLDEMTAHPTPSPELRTDMREQLFQTLRDLEAISDDDARKLREQMKARGVELSR